MKEPVQRGPAMRPRGARPRRAARPRRRWRWALLGLLFPLLFFVVIAIGVAAMAFRHMEIFRPVERGALPAAPLAQAPGAALRATAPGAAARALARGASRRSLLA